MTSGVIADSIVNLCGAIGVAVAMMTFYRRDPRSPLTRRLLLALGVIATLFLDRGLAWWSGSFVLDRLSVIPAALIPLGALIVTEGILRRHAPRPVKIAALAGGILLGLGGTFGLQRFVMPYAITLALFQLAGFATCALLLATRDRAALMASENRSIGRMAVGALVVNKRSPADAGAFLAERHALEEQHLATLRQALGQLPLLELPLLPGDVVGEASLEAFARRLAD